MVNISRLSLNETVIKCKINVFVICYFQFLFSNLISILCISSASLLLLVCSHWCNFDTLSIVSVNLHFFITWKMTESSFLNQESLRYNISKSPVTIYLRANIYAVYRIFSNNCKTLHSNSATVAGVLCTLASSQANSGTCSHVQDKCFYSKWSMIDSATTITLGN